VSTPQWFAEFERDEARRQDRLDQIRGDMKERKMTEFERAAAGLSRPQQARLAVNWKSVKLDIDFKWNELRAAELTSAIAVPAMVLNDETWDRIWYLISDSLLAAYNQGADDAINNIAPP
jgi:hypothetical protein